MAKKSTNVARKATTDEGREQQLISRATDLAEKMLLEGTATPAIILHYLRLGSSETKTDQQLKKAQLQKLNAQTEMYESTKKVEELYANAMSAFTVYSGKDVEAEDEEY